MELVVVLAILIGLAAILVPLFPNMLRRTHKATDATQTAETAKAIQLYQAAYVSYPDQFDLLLTAAGAYPSYLPGGGTAPFGGTTTINTLTANQAAALGRVGVSSAWPLATTTTQPTLSPYDPSVALSPPPAIVGGTTKAVFVNPTAAGGIPTEILQLYAADPTAQFVIFGIGQRCTMVGKTIQNAPTSVPQEKGFTPDNTYCRVGAVFLVSGKEVDKTERARFIMCVALEDDELESTEKDVVGYYNVAASP